MTILLAQVTPARAIVVADSAGVVPGYGVASVNKLWPMPLAGAVLAGRGAALFVSTIATAIAWNGADFDELERDMPDMLSRAAADLSRRIPAYRGDPAHQAVLLIGFSPARRCVVGTYFEQPAAGAGFAPQSVEGRFAAPWDAAMGDIPGALDGPAAIMAGFRAAQALGRSLDDEAFAIGGPVIAASVSRAGIETRRCGDLGPLPSLRALIGRDGPSAPSAPATAAPRDA